MRGGPYRFLTNLSGLPEASFAKLCLLGAIPFAKSAESRRTNRIACLVPQPMTLIVLATTCLLACAFYIYVLCQWMREANGKRTPRPPIDGQNDGTKENKRPFIIDSRKTADRHSSDVGSHRVPRMVRQSHSHEREWNASERIAYRKIATSLSSRNRS